VEDVDWTTTRNEEVKKKPCRERVCVRMASSIVVVEARSEPLFTRMLQELGEATRIMAAALNHLVARDAHSTAWHRTPRISWWRAKSTNCVRSE